MKVSGEHSSEAIAAAWLNVFFLACVISPLLIYKFNTSYSFVCHLGLFVFRRSVFFYL
jgi:hypothetical protein